MDIAAVDEKNRGRLETPGHGGCSRHAQARSQGAAVAALRATYVDAGISRVHR